MSKKIKYSKLDIYELEDLYKPTDDIFCEDDFSYIKLKHILFEKLDDTERRIILCYSHYGNLRDTAKLFNVSTTTIWNYISKIKKKIKKYI